MTLVPKLRKEKKTIQLHGHELVDEYSWIKQEDWQEVLKDPSKLNTEVLKYIEAENSFKDESLKDLKDLKKKILELPTRQKTKLYF
jgi:oligopeptidase B